jgi:pilus assembly protein CpaF
MTISEVLGLDSDVISMQDIFVFEQHGIDENGRVRGIFRSTSVRPQFAQRLAIAGCQLPPSLFESRMEV